MVPSVGRTPCLFRLIISFFLLFVAVIITPTRELALQTTKECKRFGKLFNLRVVAVYGGTGISEQIVSPIDLRKEIEKRIFLLVLGGVETRSRDYCLHPWTND